MRENIIKHPLIHFIFKNDFVWVGRSLILVFAWRSLIAFFLFFSSDPTDPVCGYGPGWIIYEISTSCIVVTSAVFWFDFASLSNFGENLSITEFYCKIEKVFFILFLNEFWFQWSLIIFMFPHHCLKESMKISFGIVHIFSKTFFLTFDALHEF